MMTQYNGKETVILDALLKRYPKLSAVREDILESYLLMMHSYAQGGKLLAAGNGGSAADAEHIVGELMKRFVLKRPLPAALAEALKRVDPVRGEELSRRLEMPLPAIALVAHEGLTTAFANDVDGKLGFAQQLLGFGKAGDIFIGISTSGNSDNICYAATAAKALGIRVVGLTGRDGGQLKDLSDACVIVPEQDTYLIQEYHLPIYHCWCMMLEQRFFGES